MPPAAVCGPRAPSHQLRIAVTRQKEMSAGFSAWSIGCANFRKIGLNVMAAWKSSLWSQRDISHALSSRGAKTFKAAIGLNAKPGPPR